LFAKVVSATSSKSCF